MTAIETVQRCFQKALEVEIDKKGEARVARVLPAGDSRGVVYVAVRADGQPLKVGMTLGRLRTRWNGIIDTINGKRTSRHEVRARAWWQEHARGTRFEVWCKRPSELVIGLEDEAPHRLESFHLEEAYWDSVFQPLIGLKLSTRP